MDRKNVSYACHHGKLILPKKPRGVSALVGSNIGDFGVKVSFFFCVLNDLLYSGVIIYLRYGFADKPELINRMIFAYIYHNKQVLLNNKINIF